MKIEDVKKLSSKERFVYWVQERHRIYERRAQGVPAPWTDDEILQQYYFTNPYRENDRTTKWFRETMRDPLSSSLLVTLTTTTFRWFNYIPTGQVLREWALDVSWQPYLALDVLSKRRAKGEQIFTGAFMINSPAGEPKLEAICRRITNVWNDRTDLLRRSVSWTTLRAAHADLMRYEGLGGFMAYEIVCDLRYTDVLRGATDVLTWSNPGPGAIRGLYRVFDRPLTNKSNASSPPAPRDWTERTQELLRLLNDSLPDFPTFEMREVEMSLCEVDKYNRLLFGEGQSKRKYNGR